MVISYYAWSLYSHTSTYLVYFHTFSYWFKVPTNSDRVWPPVLAMPDFFKKKLCSKLCSFLQTMLILKFGKKKTHLNNYPTNKWKVNSFTLFISRNFGVHNSLLNSLNITILQSICSDGWMLKGINLLKQENCLTILKLKQSWATELVGLISCVPGHFLCRYPGPMIACSRRSDRGPTGQRDVSRKKKQRGGGVPLFPPYLFFSLSSFAPHSTIRTPGTG